MRIAIGSDHAGFELKRHVNALLHELGHEMSELGARALDYATTPTPRDKGSSTMTRT